MAVSPIHWKLEHPAVKVFEYRCQDRPGTRPYEERHGRTSVALVRKGAFCYRAEGRTHSLAEGSVLVGNAGETYSCSHEHGWGDECLVFQWEPESLEGTAVGPGRRFKRPVLPPSPRLTAISHLALEVANGGGDLGMDEVAHALLAATWQEMEGDVKPGSSSANRKDRDRAMAAAELVRAGFDSVLPLSDLAEKVGLSPFHFLRVFRQELGLTPHQYVVRVRLKNAVSLLLETDRPITDIALDVGFNDLSHFIRTFRRALGVSPRALRKRDRKILQVVRAAVP